MPRPHAPAARPGPDAPAPRPGPTPWQQLQQLHREIGKVKTIVRSVDPHAFVVSHPLADVDGGVVKRAALH